MRKHTLLIFVLGVCVAFGAVGISSAEKPATAEVGDLLFTFNSGFTPKALPEEASAPIVLELAGKVRTRDATQPPALTAFILKADKNLAIDVRDYPTCSGSGGPRDSRTVEVECRTSILGTGSMAVSVAFEGQNPIPATSKLLLLNGGTSGGTTTLYVHAYLTQPITTAIVTTVKITKIHNGRFGTRAVATVPPIANGAGSVTSFNLIVNKHLKVGGKPFSMLDARCPDGHLKTHGLAIFKDGTRAETEVTRRCIDKG